MPERGWRKRLHDKRPKTPLQVKTAGEAAGAKTETGDKLIERQPSHQPDKLGWRKTYHGSRPETPTALPTPTSGGDEVEETRSDIGSEPTTPRRRSVPRPKLSRYLSDYLSLTATPKVPDFSEPWGEEPLAIETPGDPFLTVQLVRSHIANRSWLPVPVEHNSGLLRVFEDYRRVQEERERLDTLLKETLEGYRAAEASWTNEEVRYQEEIRRLELIIARGMSGMDGLMKARQGSVVNRKRAHKKTLSTGRLSTAYEFLTRDQLDEQIRLRSQQVVFHRPASPSGTMAALSKQFSSTGPSGDLPVGTPPDKDQKVTLSRKVKSELDLARMTKHVPSPPSVYSEFSISGDPLPDEVESLPVPAVDPGVECEAFVALRQLAILVACRRGINVDTFLSGIMKLYTTAGDVFGEGTHLEQDTAEEHKPDSTLTENEVTTSNELLRHKLRRFRSQPQLIADRNRRRHFSFEPGDDELGILNEKLSRYAFDRPRSAAGSQSTTSSELDDVMSDVLSEAAVSRTQTLRADTPKPSRIPSPLNTVGRVRRESSTSSLQTHSARPRVDDRRDSRSSVMTAFRENSSGNLRRPPSGSRSSSINNLRQAESQSQQPKDQTGTLRLRNSVVALAAARAAGTSSSASESSPRRTHKAKSRVGSSSNRTRAASAKRKSSENDVPWKRS